MDFSLLANVDILITPSCWHEHFLLHRVENPFLKFKLMTKEEVLSRAYFSFDEQAIPWVMERYGITYELAKIYLENLYFLPDVPSEDAQLGMLQSLKKELDQARLLRYDSLFEVFFRTKYVAVFGYDENDREITETLTRFHIDYHFLSQPPRTYKNLEVQAFETIEDEIQWVLNQISLLLCSGVSVDQIFVKEPPPEYHFLFEKMGAFYHLPISFSSPLSLASSQPALGFLSLLAQGVSPEEALQTMLPPHPDDVENLLRDTVQTHLPIKLSTRGMHSYFLNILRETNLKKEPFFPAIKMLSGNFVPEKGYVFVMGFNEGNDPKIQKNVDFLDDEKKRCLGRNDSTLINRFEEKNVEDLLFGPCTVFLSFKKQSLAETFIPSPLIGKWKMMVRTNPLSTIEYGQTWAKIRLGEYLDVARRYQVQHPCLASYQKQFTIPYRSYSHQYSGVHAIEPLAKVFFSYTSVNEFYECQFKYYLNHVLGLDPFEETFYSKFGQLAHALLEQRYLPSFDFEKSFSEHLDRFAFSKKERILLQRLKTEIANVIAFNDQQESMMESKQILTERKLSFSLDPDITLTGIIDKIILTGPAFKYLSLVDYKTGTVEFNPKKIAFGQSLQLPMYALLASHHPDFLEKEIIGLYIQTVITKKLIRPSGKEAQKFYFDQFRLAGLFSDDFEKLQTFDPSYRDSQFIKSLKVTQGGTLSVAAQKKTISKDLLSGYLETTVEQIRKAAAAVRANDFRINPKSLDGGELPCRNCSYRDICFRDEGDIVKIQTKENDHDAMDS